MNLEQDEIPHLENKKCTGCQACKAVCPVHAIEMRENQKGFLYPVINRKQCIQCQCCEKTCPVQEVKNSVETSYNEVYIIKHKNKNVRLHSASGGVFTALSDAIIEEKGIVCGALLNDDMEVEHRCTVSKTIRDKFCGSKYSQSNLLDCFTEIKTNLEAGRTVMFTGTPCQVDGLKHYLGKAYEKLITCDLICHGVLSPGVHRKFCNYVKTRHGDINKFDCRDKRYGWQAQKWTLKTTTYEETDKGLIKQYKRIFTRNLALRDSCYICKYASQERVADITIGDAWNAQENYKSFVDSLGVSVVWIHSNKGKELFDKCSHDIEYIKASVQEIEQPQTKGAVQKTAEVDRFWKAYQRWEIGTLLRWFGGKRLIRNTYQVMKRLLKKHLQKGNGNE